MNLLVTSYYDEILAPVIRGVCDQNNWVVRDWFIAYPSKDKTIVPEKMFPEATVHRPEFASRGMLSDGLQAAGWPAVDQSIVDRMATYEHMFMRMLDIYDPTGRAFSARERREAYYALLQFGMHVIEEHRPDLFIAGTIPHALHDYILYGLCRVLNIKTLFYMPVSLPGYLVLHDSIENGSRLLRDAYALVLSDDAPVTLPALLEDYYKQVRSPYKDAEPWYVKLRDHSFLNKRGARAFFPNIFDRSNYARKFISATRRAIKGGVNFALRPAETYRENFVTPMGDFFKKEGVSLVDSSTTRHEMTRVFKRGAKVKKRLYRQYLKLQSQPAFDVPFIFVPLHYQPEASTSPLGGAFVDQILMIRLLASYLPEGWRIYVKEHRTTFDPGLRGDFARDEEYYPQIASIKGVTLVPLSYTSFDLIDKARAVATVTGTAGWESVLRGIPSIVFGNAWYKDCHGVFDGRTATGCENAIQEIASGFKPTENKVRRFIKTVTEVGVWADRDNDYVLTTLDSETNRDTLVAHFAQQFSALWGQARASGGPAVEISDRTNLIVEEPQ